MITFKLDRLPVILLVLIALASCQLEPVFAGLPRSVEGALSLRTPSQGERIDWEVSFGSEWAEQMTVDGKRVSHRVHFDILTERQNGLREWGYDIDGSLKPFSAKTDAFRQVLNYRSVLRTAENIDRQAAVWMVGRWGVFAGGGLAGHRFRGLDPALALAIEQKWVSAQWIVRPGRVSFLVAEGKLEAPLSDKVDLFVRGGGVWDSGAEWWRIKTGAKFWIR